MEEFKTPLYMGQNKNLKEVPIHGTLDTAGFLYSPYHAQFDEQTKTQHITDNTLRDIISDELLSRAVIWLLGYDARNSIDKQLNEAPIRAQAGGSHWETAECVIHFLDARAILAESYPSIVGEIDRRLCNDKPNVNPLAWLLKEVIKRGEGQVFWYGKEYDTAVVTLALLKIRVEYPLVLSTEVKTELDQTLPKALQWLYDHLEYVLANAEADEATATILAPLIYAYEHATSLPLVRWLESYASKCENLYITLDKWLFNLEARLPSRKEGVLTHFRIGVEEAACLCRLVFTWQNQNLPTREYLRPFAERAKMLLAHYVEFLEEGLARDHWDGTLNKVRKLSTYIDACSIIWRSKQPIEEVLKLLSIVKNEFFLNGSIYQSVYPTMYFLRSLISIWKLPDAEKTVAQLYHDLLAKFDFKLSTERKESFELSISLIKCERDLANEKGRYRKLLVRERKKRYFLLGIVYVSLVVALLTYLSLSRIFSLSDVISFGGGAMTALAIIIGLTEVLFLRES